MWMNSVIDTSAAAPPPTPLKIATNWGMAVIFTKRAVGTAMTTPMNMREQDEPHVVQRVTVDVLEEGRHDGHQHAEGGDHVAAARVLGTPEALQRDDERRRREQVQQVNQRLTTHDATSSLGVALAPGAARGLNISSMRSVTTKPPDHVERREDHREESEDLLRGGSWPSPRMSIEPTRITPWIALDPLISGRVQDARHLGDDLGPHEGRQDQDGARTAAGRCPSGVLLRFGGDRDVRHAQRLGGRRVVDLRRRARR